MIFRLEDATSFGLGICLSKGERDISLPYFLRLIPLLSLPFYFFPSSSFQRSHGITRSAQRWNRFKSALARFLNRGAIERSRCTFSMPFSRGIKTHPDCRAQDTRSDPGRIENGLADWISVQGSENRGPGHPRWRVSRVARAKDGGYTIGSHNNRK